MKTIILLIPYFGKWPEWIELYVDSVRRNPNVDFLFISDCDPTPLKGIKNAKFIESSFEEYIQRYKKILGSDIQIPNPYKICDLRPFYAVIHEHDIKNYDFFGWTDIDLLYGDIRSFYNDEILQKYNVLSTHQNRLSGHLAILKNTKYYRNIGYKIYKWKNALQNPRFVGIDEHGITNALTLNIFDKFNQKFKLNIKNFITIFFSKLKKRKLFMVEQYTTPFTSISWIDGTINSNQPDEWIYKDGTITNNRDGYRNFIYLHFMNFKNSQWRHDGTKAPWEGKEKICFAKVEDMKKGITINANGINKLDN